MKKTEIFRVILLAVLLSVASSCQMKITQMSAQKYYGGIPTAGYGWYYFVEIKAPANSENIQFNEIWTTDNYANKVTILNVKKEKLSNFKKGDLIIAQFRQHTKTNTQGQPQNNAELPAPPFQLKTKALMGYTLNGKKQYMAIQDFVLLEPQNRP